MRNDDCVNDEGEHVDIFTVPPRCFSIEAHVSLSDNRAGLECMT